MKLIIWIITHFGVHQARKKQEGSMQEGWVSSRIAAEGSETGPGVTKVAGGAVAGVSLCVQY